MPLSPEIFQLPIPPILFLIPPSHSLQWLIRLLFLLYTLTVALPLITILVPLSIALHRSTGLHLLAIHPDNLPPRVSFTRALWRSYMVYSVGTIIWAITGIGNAPEPSPGGAKSLTRLTCRFVEIVTKLHFTGTGEFRHDEEVCPPVEEKYRIGAMKRGRTEEITMFSLTYGPKSTRQENQSNNSHPDHSADTPSPGKAILFFAGGGYVTGPPLAHPFLFSLARRLLEDHTIYAPNVRKSLDRARSFPIPLLDALAAYTALRRRYPAKSITIMGDSAGGGLCWSLLAYLAVLDQRGVGDLGVPGRAILISPWLALPPVAKPGYPDQVDTPQLLNAARCYMARYPLLPSRPDPFASDRELWLIAARRTTQSALYKLGKVLGPVLPRRLRRGLHALAAKREGQKPTPTSCNPKQKNLKDDLELDQWLDNTAFTSLKSHHPLVSPSTNPSHPFTAGILSYLAEQGTQLRIHVGTAEWFYNPAMAFASVAKGCGMDVRVQEEKGGFHSESCLMPGEFGGSSARLVRGILGWLEQGEERKWI